MATPIYTSGRRRRRKRFDANVRVRCTPEEHRRILANARRAGRSASHFLVELGTHEPGTLLAPAPDPHEVQVIEGLLFELHRIGVNLNQWVHLRHAAVDAAEVVGSQDGEPAELLASIRSLIDLLRQRLR